MLTGKAVSHRKQIARTLIFLLVWSTVLTPAAGAGAFRNETYQNRKSSPKQARMFYPRPGHHVKTLPRGNRAVKVGPRHYRFYKGIFYRPGPGGFIVVGAPIGARIHALPVAAVMVTIGAIAYWTYAGIYYQKVPDGYMVVTRPVKPITPDAAIAWEGDQVRVTAALLNVRSGPGREHPVVGQLKQGDYLMVRSSSTDWYYVKLPNDAFGWVMVKYTTLVKPRAVG